jgi:large subunit ribosomal protein L32
MAVPKKKTSKRRSRNRRAANMKLSPILLTKCSKCGEPKKAHVVCTVCGFYKDKKVLDVETKLDKKLKKESKQKAESDKE